MKAEHLIKHLQRLDPNTEVVSSTMKHIYNRFHDPMIHVYKKGQRDDLRILISKDMSIDDLGDFVIL